MQPKTAKDHGLSRAHNFINLLIENITYKELDIPNIYINEDINSQIDKLYGRSIEIFFKAMESGALIYKDKLIKSDDHYKSFLNQLILYFIQLLKQEKENKIYRKIDNLFNLNHKNEYERGEAFVAAVKTQKSLSGDNRFKEQYNFIMKI